MALFFYASQMDSHLPRRRFRPGIGDTALTWLNSQKQQGRGFKRLGAGDSTLAGLRDDCVLPVRVDGRQRGRPLVHLLRFI